MIKNQNEITITEEEAKECLICKKTFKSSREMIWHSKKEHSLDFENYIITSYYGGVRPVCLKTGNKLTFKGHKLGPWFSNYSKNNFPRSHHTEETKKKIKLGCEKTSMEKFGVKNVFVTNWCKEKIKNSVQKKYGVSNVMKLDEYKKKMLNSFFETLRSKPLKVYPNPLSKDYNKASSLEKDFKSKLNNLGIEFKSPFFHNGKRYDFYIPRINTTIEIDGEVFHKNKLENLTLISVNNSLNDFNKNKIIQENSSSFARVRYDPTKFVFSNIEELNENISKSSYIPCYSLKYKQKIISKEYFKKYIIKKGKDKLKFYSKLFLKFIRTFQPTLPYPDLEENLPEIISRISSYDLSRVFNKETREFSNMTYTVGHNYLKHYFKSYWKGKFNNQFSPEEAWLDDKLMQEVIDYRIGCNNSGEVFDFSLHQLVRGLSARRITISFFKPLLAASIYKIYIGNKNITPVVLDPCCGFGGRLLGFKSVYPNGTYIGCEPNKDTYKELLELINNAGWSNVKIHNCKFEDFICNNDIGYDFIFTSIPYYDVETYSDNTTYSSFEEWKNVFIGSIEKYSGKNCYINLPQSLYERLEWNHKKIDSTIISGRSHFDMNDGKKLEYIVKV